MRPDGQPSKGERQRTRARAREQVAVIDVLSTVVPLLVVTHQMTLNCCYVASVVTETYLNSVGISARAIPVGLLVESPNYTRVCGLSVDNLNQMSIPCAEQLIDLATKKHMTAGGHAAVLATVGDQRYLCDFTTSQIVPVMSAVLHWALSDERDDLEFVSHSTSIMNEEGVLNYWHKVNRPDIVATLDECRQAVLDKMPNLMADVTEAAQHCRHMSREEILCFTAEHFPEITYKYNLLTMERHPEIVRRANMKY